MCNNKQLPTSTATVIGLLCVCGCVCVCVCVFGGGGGANPLQALCFWGHFVMRTNSESTVFLMRNVLISRNNDQVFIWLTNKAKVVQINKIELLISNTVALFVNR